MKSAKLFLLFYLFSLNLFAQHKKISVLFVGNSYTYVNNIPLLLFYMMHADGDTLEWDLSAPGGYTLRQHSTDTNTLAKINAQPWDFVVLQEQSQLPSLAPELVDTATIPYAILLDSLIHANNPCTQTVFYETWGRKYGDDFYCGTYPPVCTYDGMQQRLKASYKLMADTCHAIIAPVGETFRTSIAYDSTVDLYHFDGSHPSFDGSFLVASVFYKIFNHESGLGNTYDPGILKLPVSMYHLFANETVEDSLNLWNLGIYEPWAEFTWNELPECRVAFSGNSNSNFSHYWDFGDTTFSTDANPVHQYQFANNWEVMHVVLDSCTSDTFRLVNNITCISGINENGAGQFEIFPNPADEKLFIRLDNVQIRIREISAYSATGKRILLKASGRMDVVDISSLAAGLYVLQIIDDEGHFSTRKFTVIR